MNHEVDKSETMIQVASLKLLTELRWKMSQINTELSAHQTACGIFLELVISDFDLPTSSFISAPRYSRGCDSNHCFTHFIYYFVIHILAINFYSRPRLCRKFKALTRLSFLTVETHSCEPSAVIFSDFLTIEFPGKLKEFWDPENFGNHWRIDVSSSQVVGNQGVEVLLVWGTFGRSCSFIWYV